MQKIMFQSLAANCSTYKFIDVILYLMIIYVHLKSKKKINISHNDITEVQRKNNQEQTISRNIKKYCKIKTMKVTQKL